MNIKKVIFNDPATIVFWEDGTKTVATCKEGETFDKEKGIMCCYMKKRFGKDYYTKLIKPYTEDEKKERKSIKQLAVEYVVDLLANKMPPLDVHKKYKNLCKDFMYDLIDLQTEVAMIMVLGVM